MRKGLKRAGFALVCAALFAAAGVAGFMATMAVEVAEPYRYLKVDDASLYTVDHDLESDGRDTTRYDLYLPAEADESRDYSLVFYIHGGGFTGGDKADGDLWCPYFAAKGMVAVSANYTLSQGDGVANLNTMYAELVRTANVAVEECARRGYRVTEMATTGGSAGGCLALLVAYRDPGALPVPVRFVFEQTGPASFEPDLWGQTEDVGRAAFVSMMTGRSFEAQDVGTEAYQAAIDEISPAALVDDGAVPTLMAYGPKDKVVPVALKYLLFDALDAHGVPHDYIEFPHSGHGLLGDPDRTQEFYDKMDEYIATYFENGADA